MVYIEPSFRFWLIENVGEYECNIMQTNIAEHILKSGSPRYCIFTKKRL